MGDRLRLHSLRSIDDKQRAFAGRQAARDLVGEIHMPGRVDQVERVYFAVLAPGNAGTLSGTLIVMPRSRSTSISSSI